MASIFAEILCVAIYLNDIVVYVASIESNDKRLYSRLSAVAKHHLTQC